MKKIFKTGLILIFLSVVTISANATTTTLMDMYWGANPTNNVDNDIIGSPELFDISKMVITFSGGNMQIDIYTRYLDNIGAYGSTLGDLFISTDGWRPNGPAPYKDDNMNSTPHENWEFALVLDNHQPTSTSGNLFLYAITDANILTSDAYWDPNYWVFRSGQEVRVNTTGITSLVTGTWSFHNVLTPGETKNVDDINDFMRLTIQDINNWESSQQLAFHYGANCGNDVIEGPIPEPGTLFLLGTGLLGFGIVSRIRRKRS